MDGPLNNPRTPLGGVKAFSCNYCGGQVQLRAPGQTLTAVCGHCGAIADLTDPNFKIISHWHNARPIVPLIELGTKGKLEGKTWEVIGVILRKAGEYDYYWQEYLLFNPFHGFRFLVNNQNNWSLVKMLVEHPNADDFPKFFGFQGEHYKMFTKGEAVVSAVMGEFYWQVQYGDTAYTVDYIAPPYMLSVELEGEGKVWSRGIYLDTIEVQHAFGLKNSLPKARRPGMNQPSPFQDLAKKSAWVAAAATLLILLFQFLLAGPESNSLAWEDSRQMAGSTDTLVSKPFHVKGEFGNMNVRISVPEMSNSWIELDGYLHNLKTLENYQVDLTAEYYFGTTDGESWVEGERSSESVLNAIPGGDYEFVATISAGNPFMVNYAIFRNVPIFSNLVVALILIWILPIYFLIRTTTFEAARWAESE
jgi:hypothetical protein